MKALVTGGAGFIGSTIVDMLIEDGHEVIVLDNESADCNEQFYYNPKADNHIIDICDYNSSRNFYEGVDVVFHLAAESRIQPCIKDPVRAIHTNTLGTGVVLQCAREAGVKRVIYSSTSSAYGLDNNPPLVETMKNDCLNPYSFTKVAGEELCKMYSLMFGLETIIFRYFNVYGERSPVRGQYAPVVGIFLKQKEAGEILTVVGDGEQRRDFIHVRDVAKANLLAAKFVAPEYVVTNEIIYNAWKWGEIINIGSGVNHSINNIAEMVGGEKTHIPPRQGEARTTLANISKAKKLFGWTPEIKIDQWIQSAVKGLSK